jgi:hypothetical protein
MEGQNEQTNDDLISKLKFVLYARKDVTSPPVPQTVVIGKKSIWVTNKIKLQ